MKAPPFVSVVIPAYNEEPRLAKRLALVLTYFQSQNYSVEVIVVDDGSTDRTPEIVRGFMPDFSILKLVEASHGGKGHACKTGVFESQGEWVFLCDSDLSMPIEEFARFIPFFQDYPIVITSREAPGAQRHGEPNYRHIMGRAFNLLVKIVAVRGIQDTQCGFKCFRADVAREIFAVQTINGWGFDVELLFVAQKRGYAIAEIPINWYHRSHSKVKPVQDTINMFRETWQVRINDWRGIYE